MEFFKIEYEYFLTVCETKNISRAAEKCGLVQSGLSKILKRLEDIHQTPLFYRQGRGVVLTPYARELEKHLRSLVEFNREGEGKLLMASNEVKGPLKMGSHPSIATGHGAHFLPGLLEKYPKIELEYVFAPSKEITNRVIAGELDLGLAVDPIPHPDLVIRRIASESVWAWSRAKKAVKEILYYNPDMLHVQRALRHFKEFRQIPVRDYEVLAAMAQHSDGIFLLPDSIAHRLSRLHPFKKMEHFYHICLIYRADHAKNPLFVTWIKEIMAR